MIWLGRVAGVLNARQQLRVLEQEVEQPSDAIAAADNDDDRFRGHQRTSFRVFDKALPVCRLTPACHC
jgi:hypothetical protein